VSFYLELTFEFHIHEASIDGVPVFCPNGAILTIDKHTDIAIELKFLSRYAGRAFNATVDILHNLTLDCVWDAGPMYALSEVQYSAECFLITSVDLQEPSHTKSSGLYTERKQNAANCADRHDASD